MFLYCDNGLHDDAYIITPDPEGNDIQHQYGCLRCYQFKIKGYITPVEDKELSQLFIEALGCNYWKPEVITMKTGLFVAEVLGEGLLKLADGRYIAINNCD